MVAGNWMLYGTYGYTGTLLAEEAVRWGHRPVGGTSMKILEGIKKGLRDQKSANLQAQDWARAQSEHLF